MWIILKNFLAIYPASLETLIFETHSYYFKRKLEAIIIHDVDMITSLEYV